MTRDSRSGKSVGLPTDKAVEVAKEFADKYAKHQDATSRVRRDGFRRQMLDIAKDFTYYTTSEDKSRFVAQTMIMYDDWREQHDWKNPTEEDVAQLKSTATLLVQTDPEAFLFKGEMPVPQAVSEGSFGGAKPSPKKDQESPRHKDVAPPGFGPSITPGRVTVKNKDTGAMFYLKPGVNTDDWLRKNQGWTVVP